MTSILKGVQDDVWIESSVPTSFCPTSFDFEIVRLLWSLQRKSKFTLRKVIKHSILMLKTFGTIIESTKLLYQMYNN